MKSAKDRWGTGVGAWVASSGLVRRTNDRLASPAIAGGLLLLTRPGHQRTFWIDLERCHIKRCMPFAKTKDNFNDGAAPMRSN